MSEVLVLNASFEVLNVTTIQRAIRLLFAGKAEVVHAHERAFASPTYAIRMPSIVRMLYYIKMPKKHVALTKHNILLRDNKTCQYCGVACDRGLTVDHVQPKSRGGASSWENLVAACGLCNSRKNNRTPKEANMPLLRQPKKPKYIPWIQVRRNTLPDEWSQYFFWNVSIAERVE